MISVLPPTQRPSAYAIVGRPSAADEPPWRYFATISSSENGSIASGSTHGPSSSDGDGPPGTGERRGGDRAAGAGTDDDDVGLEIGHHAGAGASSFSAKSTSDWIKPHVLPHGVEAGSTSNASTRRSSRRRVETPDELRDPRGSAEHERFGGNAEAQVFRHRTQRAVDIGLHRGTHGRVELRIHERSDDLSLEPEHGRGA